MSAKFFSVLFLLSTYLVGVIAAADEIAVAPNGDRIVVQSYENGEGCHVDVLRSSDRTRIFQREIFAKRFVRTTFPNTALITQNNRVAGNLTAGKSVQRLEIAFDQARQPVAVRSMAASPGQPPAVASCTSLRPIDARGGVGSQRPLAALVGSDDPADCGFSPDCIRKCMERTHRSCPLCDIACGGW